MNCCYDSGEETTIPVRLVNPPKLTHKIVILGDANVGKTTLVHRLIHGTVGDAEPTSGAGYNDYYIEIGDKRVHCQLWDTAGQERFHSLIPMYIRDTDLCLIALSLAESEQTNIESLTRWKSRLQETEEDSLIIIVGTKSDLSDVPIHNLEYITTSAITGQGIEELRTAIQKAVSSLLSSESRSNNTRP